MAKRILIVTTSHSTFPSTGEPTGLWLEELATPYFAFRNAGAEVEIVSVKGGKIPLDPNSLSEGALTADSKKYLADESLKNLIENSPPVTSVTGEYDAIFLPGGHGVVFDVAYDKDTIALVEKFWAEGKVVSAVCHGPSGLVTPKAPNGEPIVKGKKVSGFTNSEEDAVGKTDKVPFLLETELINIGGLYEKGADWGVYAVADGQLVTGQNPGSSAKVAELVLEALA